MKNQFSSRIRQVILFLLLILALGASHAHCNQSRESKNQVISQVIIRSLEYGHYMPQPINDQFSENVFTLFFKNLDYGKRFFTAQDFSKLNTYKHRIDDDILKGQFNFLDETVKIYRSRVTQTEEFYKEILSEPIDLYKKSRYETDSKKAIFAADDYELKLNWEKALRYQIISRIYDANALQNKAKEKSDTITIKTMEELEVDARNSVLKMYNDWFSRLSQQTDNDLFALYINAIVGVFDPHTQYLPAKDKEDFDIRMSGQLEGIGAILTSSDNYVKVVEIVPGSPSWIQGDLKVNDIIKMVRQENEFGAVDLFGMKIDDAVKLIRGKKDSKVTLTVQHIDGSIEDITITRDVVEIEETYAKSAVLVDSLTNARIGYIFLPQFYADFNNAAGGRNSGDDVAKEIEKLKSENIQGIILDLRNNSGGSLADAIKIVGLFIESGPVVQVNARNGNSRVLSDTDNKIPYDGNLVVMINPLSASASEIVSAALQDYKRAIIVGSTASFGKGTVQSVVNLDEMIAYRSPSGENSNLGSLLITIQKYFRINGGSTQLMGVKSDVVLPDLYGIMDIGERNEDFPFPWTEIPPSNFKIWPAHEKLEKAIERARERVEISPEIALINKEIQNVKNFRDQTLVDVDYESYSEKDSLRKIIYEKYDKANNIRSSVMDILSLKWDKAAANDSIKEQNNKRWISSIKKDLQLEEAVRTVLDIK